MTSFTFHKNERLKSRKTIGKIFQEGHSFNAYPIRIVWVIRDDDDNVRKVPIQFTQSVPKRKFPKAAHRNRIRRRVREAYRLNKHLLHQALDYEGAPRFALIAIYIGNKELPYDQIHHATQKWINHFIKKVKVQEKTQRQPTKEK